jgi:hypothetical protein
MLFDFEDRCFDTPTVDSAMSWREQVLLSGLIHLLVVLAVLFVPQLAFVRDAEARRAERLAEQAELLAQAQTRTPESDRPFIFVQPRVDLEAPDARLDAPLSDQDRRAQSPFGSLDPRNRLPNARGNSIDLVESEEPSGTLDDEPRIGVPADASSPDPAETPEPDPRVDDLLAAAAEVPPSRSAEAPDEPTEEAEPAEEVERTVEELLADGALTLPRPRGGRRDPDPPDPRADLLSDGLLGGTLRDLGRYVRRESFGNVYGDTDRFAPWIQFDTKGVEFGPWLRRFIAQIRRNWFIPYAALSMHGNVELTFYVQRDGTMTGLAVRRPSAVDAFTNSAFNALKSSNPTRPLPAEYPDDQAFFTVTFYFNESPPRA